MHILVKIGYQQFIVPNATVSIVEAMQKAIACDAGYHDGKYITYNEEKDVTIQIITEDKFPQLTLKEYLAMKEEIANGNQDSVE